MMGKARSAQGLPDRYGVGCLLLYFALSAFFLGRGLFGQFMTSYLGLGSDPSLHMWLLAWWPHALAHHLNPFHTEAVWAPSGFNLAWTTGMPLASLATFPLTHFLGPVAAYNILILIALPLDAWAAFILCRHITKVWWPSVLGGYIFGFSSYMLGQLLAHPPFILVFAVPFAVYLVARRILEEIKASTFVATLAAVLAVQFLLSIEIFSTMTIFGAMTIALAISFNTTETRKRLFGVIPLILISYAVTLAAMSPYLYELFAFGFPPGSPWVAATYSADLFNFVIPTPVNVLGGIGLFHSISNRFTVSTIEAGSYLGIPLFLIAVAFARRHWHEPFGKLLIDSLVIICVLSLGPFLHVAGRVSIGLPGKLLARLPIVDKALPARFAMYAFLDLAIITSLWVAQAETRKTARHAIAILAVLFLLPNPSAYSWVTPVDTPVFFSSGMYRNYLRPGETVLVLPFGPRGNSMLWQAQTYMYFRMAGGWIGPVPAKFQRWPIVPALYDGDYLPEPAEQLKAYLASHGVSTVIVDNREEDAWRPLLSTLGTAPMNVGGISLYKVPPATLAAYRNLTALDMAKRAGMASFTGLILAADRYLSNGGSTGALTPRLARKLDLLPRGWIIGPPIPPHWGDNPDVRFDKGIWLGPWSDGRISVGVAGSYGALAPVIERFGLSAAHVYFPFPEKFSPASKKAGRYFLVMVFDRAQLARAGARLSASAQSAARAELSAGASRRATSR
jgi:hypothetical protein